MKFVLEYKSFKCSTGIENLNHFNRYCSADNCLDLKSGGILEAKTLGSQSLGSGSWEHGLYSCCGLISSLSGVSC